MEFGKLPDAQLDRMDFALPRDPDFTSMTLKKGGGNTKFYIGCAKWGRKDWVGKLYPAGTREKDYLRAYGRLFNSIEFNGFFYSTHSEEQVRKWCSQVPEGFLFCPKFTQSITHDSRLKNVRAETEAFLSVIRAFGSRLGPVFLMPHPQMGPDEGEVVRNFIADLPADIPLFLELRHEGFYTHGYDRELLDFLAAAGRGTVITDAAGRRDCVHMHLTTPECFIRFVGNALHPSDYSRIDDWVMRISQWVEDGLETCYFFMHQHDELHSPELIRYFINRLNKYCETSLVPPQMQPQPGTLF